MPESLIRPYQYVALRLLSDAIRVLQLVPSTTISLGKYGSFNTNHVLGRPFHLTFEILDPSDDAIDETNLRLVSPVELNADVLIDASPPNEDDVVDQKTTFSLAKYTDRKNKKYLKRFTVLPLDVPLLADWMMNDKDFTKVLELRNEALGLIGCWANVHYFADTVDDSLTRRGRWLVVDDTGGLLVAAIAERMGILSPSTTDRTQDLSESESESESENENENENSRSNAVIFAAATPSDHDEGPNPPKMQDQARRHRDASKKEAVLPMSSRTNTITVLHANSQPNLSLLKYFGFDMNAPSQDHPLYARLKTLSWLQLLEPESDPTYAEPEEIPPEILSTWKSNKRGAYFRKRRRWERVRSVIEETRTGGFDGLIVASMMHPSSILHHTVPLLAGAAQVAIYSPNVEPLVEIADLYSTGRRVAFLNTPLESRNVPSQNFPVDPRLLLGPMLQTARVRKWQALVGRTHPLMSGKGGAEGYTLHATRVIPAEGKVEARGKGVKRRKVDSLGTTDT